MVVQAPVASVADFAASRAGAAGVRALAGRQWTLLTLAAAACLVSITVMPVVYALVAYHGALAPLKKAPVLEHLASNCGANLLVMLGALRARGRLDQRLGALFSLTLLVHGGLAFLTLVTRHFYSIPMMVVGGAASSVLGAGAIYARSRAMRLRVGILGPWHPIFEDPNIDCLSLDPDTASLRNVDLVLVTFADGHEAAREPLLLRALLHGRRVRHVAEYIEEAQGACALEHFDLDQVSARGLTNYRPLKRALDIVLVLASLPLSLPILGLAAFGVLVTMGRPIFFVQPRVGRGGMVFEMFKLRTMRVAPPASPSVATSGHDSRITPFGGFLRRFRIDELPQILNVLLGQMSVIGPRPEWAPLAEIYARQEPKYALRHLVRPGITGWAQVRASYAADLAETRVKLSYDLFYLKSVSFALDMQILFRTLWTLAAGGGVR
jgi:lipopolysaccharide/colanic/teichoic acid biosynthesis glycosyltransferase